MENSVCLLHQGILVFRDIIRHAFHIQLLLCRLHCRRNFQYKIAPQVHLSTS
ncbi:hypothetical protein MtrunA17_Chr6g0478511 [Medicago truncatula]|uniref:Uncharacterized protein n=1 Tax=Medicago truncatula TaxID=3880 RepID=I3SAL4_MEDTR|nr:unknown [Medicago truncatula]RHN52255.1 hypothetical protein MtrunA17_Chr6g0478511 [Medicago truncatula]